MIDFSAHNMKCCLPINATMHMLQSVGVLLTMLAVCIGCLAADAVNLTHFTAQGIINSRLYLYESNMTLQSESIFEISVSNNTWEAVSMKASGAGSENTFVDAYNGEYVVSFVNFSKARTVNKAAGSIIPAHYVLTRSTRVEAACMGLGTAEYFRNKTNTQMEVMAGLGIGNKPIKGRGEWKLMQNGGLPESVSIYSINPIGITFQPSGEPSAGQKLTEYLQCRYSVLEKTNISGFDFPSRFELRKFHPAEKAALNGESGFMMHTVGVLTNIVLHGSKVFSAMTNVTDLGDYREKNPITIKSITNYAIPESNSPTMIKARQFAQRLAASNSDKKRESAHNGRALLTILIILFVVPPIAVTCVAARRRSSKQNKHEDNK